MKKTPKFETLFAFMEEIFGTCSAPVREVEVMEPTAPEFGACEDGSGAYYAHEIIIRVKIDSREPKPTDHLRPAALRPSGPGEPWGKP